MKSESRMFNLLAGFLFVAAAVYWFWTYYAFGHHGEWIGTVALVLTGLLCLMMGGFFWFVARRIEPRPEDREDAEMADGAGDVGFFSPGSYWPFGLALAAAVTGIGLVFWYVWLIAAGMLAVLIATGGLLFEYYTGARGEHYHGAGAKE